MINPLLRSAAILIFLAFSNAHLNRSFGHGVEIPRPTPEELAQVQPALPDSEKFAQLLLEHWRGRLTPEQAAVMDDMGRHLAYAEEIRRDRKTGSGAAEAEFHRWRAENHLLALLGKLSEATVDLRESQNQPDGHDIVNLARHLDLFILQAITGDGAPRLTIHSMDMTSERDSRPYTIAVSQGATNYVLLELHRIPSEKSVAYVDFQVGASPGRTLRRALTFLSPPSGNVVFSVVDENNKPTPALVRLTSVSTRRLFEPAGACDLRAMMNDVTSLPIYGPGRGYMVYIPGPFQGRYWVVPGPFEMKLPSGEWEAHILHGIEYIPVHEKFVIGSGSTTRKKIKLQRWADMPKRGWYSGDDHVHSRLIDSEDAEKLMAFTRAADIHVSNVLEMGNEMRTWYAQRGFGPEFHVREGNHWLVPGQEDPRSMLGHAIGLNLTAKVRDMDHYYLNDWIAAEIHRQGGLYGHTHVGNSEVKTLFTERQMALFTPMNIVDFNSILQTKLGVDLFYNYLNMGFKMTASAGSDTPYGGTVGSVRVYAYCGKRGPFVPARWFDAVKRGRTFVTTGPMLDFRVEDARPGEEIALVGPRPMQVKIRAWGMAGASAPVELRLIQFGRVIKEVVPEGKEATELKLETTIAPEQSCWLAAQVRGANGSVAHTTPIYLVKPGTRFWDPTQAGPLLDGQLQLLEEIEHAVADAEKAKKSGNNPLDYWNRWPAEQAPQIRERVATMRKVYLGMLAELGARHPNRGASRAVVPTGVQVSMEEGKSSAVGDNERTGTR